MIEIFGCLLKLEYLAKFSHLCVNHAWEGLKGPLSILTTFASKMGFCCSSKYAILYNSKWNNNDGICYHL